MIPLLFDGSLDQMILSEWIQALARGDAEETRFGSMALAVKQDKSAHRGDSQPAVRQKEDTNHRALFQ